MKLDVGVAVFIAHEPPEALIEQSFTFVVVPILVASMPIVAPVGAVKPYLASAVAFGTSIGIHISNM